MPRSTTLHRLIDPIRPHRLVGPAADPEIRRVDHDSRVVGPGSMFCCVPGLVQDGHDHAPGAVESGAVALLCERELGLDVPQVVVPSVRRVMGPVAARLVGEPSASIPVVGVTGTNGKTTTVHLISQILAAAGRRADTIGTLTGARTTPEGPDLQRLLGQAHDRDAAVVMEVSSHALELHRVDGTRFAVAAFTNLSRDHLDFHGDMEAYFAAKARLFTSELADRAVVSVGDRWGRRLAEQIRIPVTTVDPADIAVRDLDVTGFSVDWAGVEVRVGLGGRFNVANVLVAAHVASLLGLDDGAIRDGLASVSAVPGRFEVIATGGGTPPTVVDYAHTPDGLENLLHAVRDVTAGRVVAVVGCGGDRDVGKRPLMGAIGARLADTLVVTSDNPRSEDPAAIVEDILGGVPADRAPIVEIDRRSAIERALHLATSDDVVVVAGKGHETTQIIGERVLPFDDRDVVRSVLRAGESAPGDSAGRAASGDGAGRAASGDSAGRAASGDSAGRAASGDSAGRAASGDSELRR